MKVIEPGIYENLPNETYHNSSGISKSGLDKIAQSPALYKYTYLDGNRPDPTPAMIIGSATHTAVFEPHLFAEEYAVAPAINKRTKAGKAAFAEFLAENEGKTVLTDKENDQITAIAEAVRTHPLAQSILAEGMAEVSIYQNEFETGELVKVRPDWMCSDVLVDLKTAVSASPEEFQKALYNRRYDVQAAMYLDIANQAYSEIRFSNFLFIVVEKTEPYQVAFYFADPEVIRAGRIRYQSALKRFVELRKANDWPGYNDDKIVPISMPYWAMRLIEGAA